MNLRYVGSFKIFNFVSLVSAMVQDVNDKNVIKRAKIKQIKLG